jgi:hypothetical protein
VRRSAEDCWTRSSARLRQTACGHPWQRNLTGAGGPLGMPPIQKEVCAALVRDGALDRRERVVDRQAWRRGQRAAGSVAAGYQHRDDQK